MSNMQSIIKWKHHHFTSGAYIGDDFKDFSKDFKSYLKRIMDTVGGTVLSFNRGHYYCSAFIMRSSDNQVIYISTPDVRWGENEFNRILVRTAVHEKDFTGGSNRHTPIEDLSVLISKIR